MRPDGSTPLTSVRDASGDAASLPVKLGADPSLRPRERPMRVSVHRRPGLRGERERQKRIPAGIPETGSTFPASRADH